MTTKQNFSALGSLVFAMTKWIKLRQWARRNGQTQTVENCDKWIADCQARGKRINHLPVVAMKESA
jgi:hypothetical protein